MTMNIPLSLVTSANANAANNSPVLWDGSDIVVSKEQLINLDRLRADLNMLVTKQAEYSSEFVSIKNNVEVAKNSVYGIVSANKLAVKKIEGASKDTARLDLAVFANGKVMGEIAVDFEQNQKKLEVVKTIGALVKSGSLFGILQEEDSGTSTKNQSIAKSRLGEYVFVDTSLDDISLVPGKNVSIKYNLAKGTYGISFDYPKTSEITKEGHGIDIETDKQGRTKINIKENFLQVSGGLFCQTKNNKLYAVGILPTFISTKVGGGIISKTSTDGFDLSLDQSLLEYANSDYVFSNGLKKVGNKIELETGSFPILAAKDYAKVVVSQNTSTIYFEGLPQKPKPTGYSAEYPLILTKAVDDAGNILRLDYKLDPVWLAKPEEESESDILQKTRDYVTAIEKKAKQKRTWADVGDSMRAILACPILNLYKVFQSGAATISGTSSDKKLAETLGYGQTTITLDVDILPYYSMMPVASFEFGFAQEFDLYLILQYHLQKLQKDSSFVIDDASKNTKYKIFALSGYSFGTKKLDDIQMPSYNQEIVAKVVFDQQKLSTDFVEPKSWLDSNGRNFRVTSGDTDYILGNSRNGQTNIDRIEFPPDLVEDKKVVFVALSKQKELGGTKYIFVVQDEYSSGNYMASFFKKVGYDRNPDQDYIIELEGNTNPGHVRAFCRLYVNWEHNDTDLNKLLFLLGQNNSEFCTYFSSYYTDELEKGTKAENFDSLYYQRISELGVPTIEVEMDNKNVFDTGILKVTANMVTIGYQEIVPSVLTMLKQLNIVITYIVDTRIGVVADSSKLFDPPCC